MFFVSGITGHVGGATARHLLAGGHAVRALARDPQKAKAWSDQGVEVRQGEFEDADTVASALEGVEGAFLMVPPMMAPAPGFPEAKAVLASFREALRRSPPPRLALLSSVGSEQPHGLGLITPTHMMEEALGDLPMPTAFVRAGSFVENNLGLLEPAKSSGVFPSFMQPTDRPFPTVATDDIGREVARLLVAGWTGKMTVELGSPVSPDDLARAMGEVLGRPVRAQAVPRSDWASTLEQIGFPPGGTGAYEEMIDGLNSGWIHFGVNGTQSVPGTVTPAQVFAQAKP